MISQNISTVDESLNHENYKWTSYDGFNLYVQSWIPDVKCKALILIIHDIGEHSSRYSEWAVKFVKAGFGVLSYDLRGNGFSKGKRDKNPSYKKHQKDLSAILNEIKEQYGDLPLILYGQGLGANIIINNIINEPQKFDGIIITSPWFELTEIQNYFLHSFGNYIMQILPNIKLNPGLNPEALSRDLRIIHDYKTDNLVSSKMTLRCFVQSCNAGEKASKSIYRINIPLLVLHGTADAFTSVKASKKFVMNSSNKTQLILYEDAFHELHHDLCSEQVFSDIHDWLQKNITQPSIQSDDHSAN